ncbi:hypothetical protein [Neglectibacter timonensis]|uniref:hypothetical protein n=1 Tax=Oscillospiraceae TaxID=216572 RepID=UPI003995392F
MNFFEKELRDLFGSSTTLRDAHYCGRTCLAKLDEDLRVKLQFTTTGYADHYDAIKLAVINRTDGVVDQQLFRFSDIIDQQHSPGMMSVTPQIWDDNGKPEWYRPISQEQRSQIANTILDYVGMYQGETPENDFSMKL